MCHVYIDLGQSNAYCRYNFTYGIHVIAYMRYREEEEKEEERGRRETASSARYALRYLSVTGLRALEHDATYMCADARR